MEKELFSEKNPEKGSTVEPDNKSEEQESSKIKQKFIKIAEEVGFVLRREKSPINLMFAETNLFIFEDNLYDNSDSIRMRVNFNLGKQPGGYAETGCVPLRDEEEMRRFLTYVIEESYSRKGMDRK